MGEAEESVIIDNLVNLYNCDFDHVPTEVLTHIFVNGVFSESLKNYSTCLRAKENGRSFQRCKSHLVSVCPQSFDDIRLKRCEEVLAVLSKQNGDVNEIYARDDERNRVQISGILSNDTARTESSLTVTQHAIETGDESNKKEPEITHNTSIWDMFPETKLASSTNKIEEMDNTEKKLFQTLTKIKLDNDLTLDEQLKFVEHSKCMAEDRRMTHSCFQHLRKKCTTSSIITIKTIRLTMKTVGKLLKRIPDLKVIHVFRDPAKVVLSRKRKKLLSSVSKGKLLQEADLLCQNMITDIRERITLEKHWPKSFMPIYLEQFSQLMPRKILKRVYKTFLSLQAPYDLEEWVDASVRNLTTNTNYNLSSTDINDISVSVRRICLDLYRITDRNSFR